jgi:hypothetical protein
MIAVLTAFTSVVLAALLVLAGYAGGSVLLAAVALVVVVVAIGWAVLLQLPDVRGTSLVIVLTGWAAVGAAWWSGGGPRPLATFAVVVALAVLAAFAHELMRRDGRPKLVESVTGTLSGQIVALLAVGWVLLPDAATGVAGLVVAAVAVAGARLAGAFPLPDRAAGWVCLAAGTVAGAVTGFVLEVDSVQACVVAALAVAGVVAGLDRLLATQTATQTAAQTETQTGTATQTGTQTGTAGRGSVGLLAAAAAPVSSVGMVAYTVLRLLTG